MMLSIVSNSPWKAAFSNWTEILTYVTIVWHLSSREKSSRNDTALTCWGQLAVLKEWPTNQMRTLPMVLMEKLLHQRRNVLPNLLLLGQLLDNNMRPWRVRLRSYASSQCHCIYLSLVLMLTHHPMLHVYLVCSGLGKPLSLSGHFHFSTNILISSAWQIVLFLI